MFVQLLFIESLTIKLIKMSFHLQFRTGSGFRKPLYILYKALACQQVQQLKTYLLIILCMFSQQYSRWSSSRVFPRPGQLATSRSCTCLRSLSLSSSQLGITRRFQQYKQSPRASHSLREILLERLTPSRISLSVSWMNSSFGYSSTIIYLINQSVISKTCIVRSLVGGLNSSGRSRV